MESSLVRGLVFRLRRQTEKVCGDQLREGDEVGPGGLLGFLAQ